MRAGDIMILHANCVSMERAPSADLMRAAKKCTQKTAFTRSEWAGRKKKLNKIKLENEKYIATD